MLAAYRSVSSLLLGALPVATGALAGIAVMTLCFAEVHGITLAFGFTLLGVAQEYPIRLLSHRRAGESAVASVRGLWPLLLTAIASACIAYLAFYASGVGGLETAGRVHHHRPARRGLLHPLRAALPAARACARCRRYAGAGALSRLAGRPAASALVAHSRRGCRRRDACVRAGSVLAERPVGADAAAARPVDDRRATARRTGRAGCALPADRAGPDGGWCAGRVREDRAATA